MSANRAEQVEAEVERLLITSIADVRTLWRAKFRSEPPPAYGPDLLRRGLAQKLQEDAFGGLSVAARRLLNQLIVQHAKGQLGRIILPRRIKPGSVLVREWKGTTHRVMVMNDGFAFGDRSYSNLSEIARVITGTRWNGPRFFGLRPDIPKAGEGYAAPAPARASHKRVGSSTRRPANSEVAHDA